MINQLAKEASDSHEIAEEVMYVYFNKEQLWVLSIIIYDKEMIGNYPNKNKNNPTVNLCTLHTWFQKTDIDVYFESVPFSINICFFFCKKSYFDNGRLRVAPFCTLVSVTHNIKGSHHKRKVQFFLTLFKQGGGHSHVQKLCCKFWTIQGLD